jgi:putative membrane protein
MPAWCAAGAGFWWIVPLVFAVFWVTLVVLLVRRGRWWWHGGPGHPGYAQDASSVLRERFARGEIDVDEYQRRLRVLDNR